jgi:hypothetical protein
VRAAQGLGCVRPLDCTWAATQWGTALALLAVLGALVAARWSALVIGLRPTVAITVTMGRRAAAVGVAALGLAAVGVGLAAPVPTSAGVGLAILGAVAVTLAGRSAAAALGDLHDGLVELPKPMRWTSAALVIGLAASVVFQAASDCRLGICAAAQPWRNSHLWAMGGVVLAGTPLAASLLRAGRTRTMLVAVTLTSAYVIVQGALTAAVA